MSSKHLDEIMSKQERTINVQVVFVDIEKYSKRRTSAQISIIDEFTSIVNESLQLTSKEYINYIQKNGKNFLEDLIILPTGDGLAIAFSFNGINDAHLFLSKTLLSLIEKLNSKNECTKFISDGWCNCHKNMNLRIGLSEGKAILYKDITDKYNVAGNVVNMAARVMGLIDRNQIAFTQTAYEQIIDIIEDPNFSNQFKEYNNVRIKHGERISVYQYIGGESDTYINKSGPEALEISCRSDSVIKKLRTVGMPFPSEDLISDNPSFAVETLESMSGIMEKFLSQNKKLEKIALSSSQETK